MWLRATDAGTVLLYAARGIRNPFTQPSVLSAEDTDRWAEIAASLMAAADGNGPIPVLRPHAEGGRAQSAVLGGGDVVLDIASPTTSPAVVLRIGASGSQALSTTLSAALLHEVVPALRETARLAREMAAVRLAAHGMGGASAAARTPDRTIRRPNAGTPGAPAVLPVRALAPVLITQAPLAALPADRGYGRVAARADLRLSATAPDLPVWAAPIAPIAPVAPIASVAHAESRSTAAVAVPAIGGSPAASPTTDANALAGRLAPAAIGDYARKRQPLLAYCYTRFGLSADSSLTGRLSMRVALSADGDVMHTEVANRHWWGRGGDGVESCVRERVSLWRFPPAPHAGTYEFGVYFNK